MGDNRYARQIPFWGEEGQKKIEETKVGIVGLGGLGSQIAQGLAYLGVRSFALVDDDHIDETNLNRTVTALSSDARHKVLKVVAAERGICQIKPEVSIQVIPKNLRSREAMEVLISCPAIFGCVDHDSPRLILTELAAAYNAVLIDCASEINLENVESSRFGGRIVVARPGDFCLTCANEIDMEVAIQELETPETQELRRAHGYGLGKTGSALSVVSLNGVVANLAITEFAFMITGIREPFRHMIYYGQQGKINIRTDKRRDDCYVCSHLVGSGDRANIFRYVIDEDEAGSHSTLTDTRSIALSKSADVG